MKLKSLLMAACTAALIAAPALAAEYQPQPYQEGKDVIWLPTPNELVEKMLDLGQVTAKDVVIDLGSGDGRTVIAAAKRGARALGIEYNPDMVEFATRAAQKAGVAERARFIKADLFETDFGEATVITMYLLTSLNAKLRPKILDLKAGTRVVSHAFDMGDWTPERSVTVEGRTAYLWIVPAKIAGTWHSAQGEFTFRQNFQTFEGTLKYGTSTVQVTNGRILGDRLSFNAGNSEYSGRVSGNRIDGIARGASSGAWNATLRSDNPVSSPLTR